MPRRIEWTQDLVNKFWDGVAQTELDSLSFGKVAGPQFLELISKYLVEGRTYLDFGAGSGHVLQLLLDRGLHAAGFDPAPDRHSRLIEKIGRHNNFLGILGSDSDRQFDVVLLMEVIEHVLDEDFVSVLERVSRFVKPGGYLIVSTPNNESLESSGVYCPVSDTFFHPWQHVRSFTPSQLAECIGENGFTVDFLALADFSSDASLIENCKNNVAVEKLKESSLNQLIASVETSITEYRRKLAELDRVDAALKSGVQLGYFERIKLRFHVLKNYRKLISSLHNISHDMAHRFDEISGYVAKELRQTMQIKNQTNVNSSKSGGAINMRIGRETTIVYVGKKSQQS